MFLPFPTEDEKETRYALFASYRGRWFFMGFDAHLTCIEKRKELLTNLSEELTVAVIEMPELPDFKSDDIDQEFRNLLQGL